MTCNLVLKIEQVLELAFKAISPDGGAGFRVDKLTRDANTCAGFAQTAFQNVTDPQFTTNVAHIHCATFVLETRIACDDEQPMKA